MDDEAFERHRQSLDQACAALGISPDILLESAAGRWYVLRMGQELQDLEPPVDVSLAVSNTIELATDLPTEQRQVAQGIGIAQVGALLDTEPPSSAPQ